jgi:hypothetical protein
MSATANDCVYAVLTKGNFVAVATTVHFEAQVFIESDDVTVYPGSIFVVGKNRGPNSNGSILIVDPGSQGNLSIDEQVSLTDGGELDLFHSSAVPIPPRRWSKVVLDADFVQRRFNVTVDGVPFIGESVDMASAGPGVPYVRIGFHCMSPSSKTRRVRFDNVLFDAW